MNLEQMRTNMDIENVVQRLRAMNADGVGYVGHAADVIEALQNDLRIEILQRERKIAEADSFIKAIADTCEFAERVAAESQAREKDMRDVLLLSIESSSSWRYSDFLEARTKVLEQPTDDTALKQMLAAERERYDRELLDLLPGTYYMDPPDGGDVTILEQLKRIAEDAARYRWIRSRKGLVLQSDCGIWTRPDGTQFSASHYLAEGGTQHTPEESLDETINAAMRINP